MLRLKQLIHQLSDLALVRRTLTILHRRGQSQPRLPLVALQLITLLLEPLLDIPKLNGLVIRETELPAHDSGERLAHLTGKRLLVGASACVLLWTTPAVAATRSGAADEGARHCRSRSLRRRRAPQSQQHPRRERKRFPHQAPSGDDDVLVVTPIATGSDSVTGTAGR